MSGDTDESLSAKQPEMNATSVGLFNALKNFLHKLELDGPNSSTLMRGWISSTLMRLQEGVATLSCDVHGQDVNADCHFCLVRSDLKASLFRLNQK